MRYKIYGNDINSPPFVRKLQITDSMEASDIYDIIKKFWTPNIYISAQREYERTKDENKKPELFLGSDKDKCLSLLVHTGSSIRRLGILLPETHPLFNFEVLVRKWNMFKNHVSSLYSIQFIQQMETFI